MTHLVDSAAMGASVAETEASAEVVRVEAHPEVEEAHHPEVGEGFRREMGRGATDHPEGLGTGVGEAASVVVGEEA